MVEPRALWHRINHLRCTRGWKWYIVVADSDVSEKTFKRWSRGFNTPSVETLQRVAKAFEISLEALLADLPRVTHHPSDPPPSEPPPPPSLRSSPLVFDPWKPAVGANFVGRAQTIEDLAGALDRGGSVSLLGDRRIGKSSLLLTWGRVAREHGHDVTILNSEELPGLSADVLVEAITGERSEPDPDAAADVLLRWIKGRPGRKQPLILIDEFDDLARCVQNRFFQRIRGIVGNGQASFVLATRRDISELSEPGATSPLANLLSTVQLGLLEPYAAAQIIDRHGALIAPDGADLLRRWSGRHPFYLQLLGHHLTGALRNGASNERTLEDFRADAQSHLQRLWNHLSPREHEALLGRDDHPKILNRLKRRGVLDDDLAPFGEVLVAWLDELSR